MSWLDTYRAFARYNRWMNERLYALAAELGDEERKRDVGAFFGSLHATLEHLVFADRVWLARFTADSAEPVPLGQDGRPIEVKGFGRNAFPSFERLRAERIETDQRIEAWIETLEEALLDRDFTYRNLAGESQSHPMWWAVQHFFNHQTHHRGQATTILKQLGRDPGVTDYVQFLRLDAAGKAWS
ncbi:MAG: DinB family protein [bacterium]